MHTTTRAISVGLIVVIAFGALLWFTRPGAFAPTEKEDDSVNDAGTAEATTHSDGTITFSVPAGFGLAVNQSSLPNTAVPPCAPMDATTYCLYHNSDEYSGTNFVSAGVRIKKRLDLPTKKACLETPPTGYQIAARTTDFDTYSTGVFFPLGSSGAGHYSTGALHRVHYGTACYEFETRIGEAQIANFEPGTISEFTMENREIIEQQLRSLLEAVTLPGGIPIDFEPTYIFKG